MHESINNNISSCETINIISYNISLLMKLDIKKFIMNETIKFIINVMN